MPRYPLVAAVALVALAVPAAAEPGSFIGTDGATYQSAPLTVAGRDGVLYYGPDFDVACGFGPDVAASYRRLARLARVIERSGRTVVWTVAPSKTGVVPRRLPEQPPHGACDEQGLDDVRRALDGLEGPTFLPLRKPLAESPHQAYFDTDLHWTTVGGSVFARRLAAHLDPRVARLQRYEYGTETRQGNLNFFLGDPTTETAETATPAGPVTSRTARRSASRWSGYPEITHDYSWVSLPARHTIPGRTVVVGDSFGLFALDSLLPLFRRGRFIWVGHVPTKALLGAIRRADTVVLEAAQVFLPLGSRLTRPGFRQRLTGVLNASRTTPP